MMAMSQQTALVVVWIVYAAGGVTALLAVLVWAVRSRQFTRQNRARHLALRSGMPREDEDEAPRAAEPHEDKQS